MNRPLLDKLKDIYEAEHIHPVDQTTALEAIEEIARLRTALGVLHESKAMNAWAHEICRAALLRPAEGTAPLIQPPLTLTPAQVEALKRPDTRTEAEIIRDGVAFVMGDGLDEGTTDLRPTKGAA